MRHIRFIRNWNGSELILDAGSSTYTEEIVKDTANVLDGLCQIGEIEFDGERFMGDDFFVSEPREASLKFLLDSAGWLRDKFLFSNEAEEINHTLYYDEDGEIISYEGSPWFGVDPDWDIGDPSNVHGKEVLIQQFSKYIVQIYDVDNLGDEKILFTGLVNKAETKVDGRTIEIQCYDMLKLVEVLGKQLIKVISPIDDDIEYGYIYSPSIIYDFLVKLRYFTKLNIDSIGNDVNNYNYSTYEVLVSNFNSASIFGNNPPIFPSGWGVYNISEVSNTAIFGSMSEKVYIGYRWCTYYRDEQKYIVVNGVYTPYIVTYQYIYIEHKKSGPEMDFVNYPPRIDMRLKEYNHLTGDDYIINTIDNCLRTYREGLQAANGFNIGLYSYALVSKSSSNQGAELFFDSVKLSQDVYGLTFPAYEDKYEYLEIIRAILYMNFLCMYCSGSGAITLIKKENLFSTNSAKMISLNDIEYSYSISAVEKGEYQAGALDIVWYDFETSGELYNNLDNYLKARYANIFINRYPLEFDGKIFTHRLDDNSPISLELGEMIYMFDKFWVITEITPNATNYVYDIKAYNVIYSAGEGGGRGYDNSYLTKDNGELILTDSGLAIDIE